MAKASPRVGDRSVPRPPTTSYGEAFEARRVRSTEPIEVVDRTDALFEAQRSSERIQAAVERAKKKASPIEPVPIPVDPEVEREVEAVERSWRVDEQASAQEGAPAPYDDAHLDDGSCCGEEDDHLLALARMPGLASQIPTLAALMVRDVASGYIDRGSTVVDVGGTGVMRTLLDKALTETGSGLEVGRLSDYATSMLFEQDNASVVILSFALSSLPMRDRAQALLNAEASVTEGGAVIVVDDFVSDTDTGWFATLMSRFKMDTGNRPLNEGLVSHGLEFFRIGNVRGFVIEPGRRGCFSAR